MRFAREIIEHGKHNLKRYYKMGYQKKITRAYRKWHQFRKARVCKELCVLKKKTQNYASGVAVHTSKQEINTKVGD